eukprot:gb/GECG01001245.1/.p1 GENE.gb/GECG01001245.1/~~gb/GECG01001245.1/.p1  ORF type:complete len:510 (+),score=51.42 gb/GECG01001245.1/:1-1530(+)
MSSPTNIEAILPEMFSKASGTVTEIELENSRRVDSIDVPTRDALLSEWKEGAAAAEAVLPLIGELYRRNIVVNVCGRPTANLGIAELQRLHAFAANHFDRNISLDTTWQILRAVHEISMQPFRVDAGLLVTKLKDIFGDESRSCEDKHSALVKRMQQEIADIEKTISRPNPMQEARDVVLYGFGRIGRLLARILIDKTGAGVKLLLRAIVVRKKKGDELLKRATLLAHDSVHGSFRGTISVDKKRNLIIANGNAIHLIHSDSPENVDYTSYGINDAIVVDNTGVYRDKKNLERHLKANGVSKVVLTAPVKGSDVPTVVAGVNEDRIVPEHSVYSAASCTTNAIVPVLKVMNDAFGIQSGHVETVHSYTNDQNLLDNYHDKSRRGRSAPLNMVITETGAASAVAKAIPQLEHKLTGNAIRVPTADVSMALLFLRLQKPVSREEANRLLFAESTWGRLHRQLEYSHEQDGVSSDFVGESHTAIVDSHATIANGESVNIYVWYVKSLCRIVR